MQNLGYKIDVEGDDCRNAPKTSQECTDLCAACGEQLIGPAATASSWQAWGAFWRILGNSNVELVCSACGEYLQGIFDNRT